MFGYLFQQAAAHRGFARADLTGQQDATAFAVEAINQMSECFTVLFGHIKIARVGGDGKRSLLEIELRVVHGCLAVIVWVDNYNGLNP